MERSGDRVDFTAARAGLAGWFSWVVPTLADRDLFSRDLHVVSGWGPCPSQPVTAKAASPMLELSIHPLVKFVLVRPHYPENVGAAARAMKTMGFTRLVLVKPGKMAEPSHVMAVKMAVKSLDVLEAAPVFPDVKTALSDVDFAYATTARRGVSGVLTARGAAEDAIERAARGLRIAFVFGNEKTGLAEEDLLGAHARMRIPMAADQPSINLGQAVQVTAYELFVAALAARQRRGGPRE